MRAGNHPAGRTRALPVADEDRLGSGSLGFVIAVSVLLATTTWSYWAIIASLIRGWQSSQDYSAGMLVPLVALFLVWRERSELRKCLLAPFWLGGIGLVLLAQAARLFVVFFAFRSAEPYTFVLTIAGLVLMVAGWQMFRHLSWVLLFLFLMLPFPGPVHREISGPLQRMATTGSVVLLEAVGASVQQQGNVVMLGERTPMAVAEACSGLRMLTAFIIVAAFIAYMVKRPRWQKAVLLASSIPVAVVCNIVRIFATGLLMLHVSSEVGEKFFHDFAGLVMMPAAVLLLFGELWLLDKIVVPEGGTTKPNAPSASFRTGTRPVASESGQIVHAKRKAEDPKVAPS
jgi:exosortase